MKNFNEIVDNVSKFIDECTTLVGKYEADRWDMKLISDILNSDGRLESPIEEILYAALRTLIKINGFREWDNEPTIHIIPQIKIGMFRVDFGIKNTHPKHKHRLVVECDSQQFHERTEKERRYEKARDRYLIKNGFKIFHYTGSEIVKEPFRVAKEILEEVTDCDHINNGSEI